VGPSLRRLMQSINPITFSCWYSTFEYFQVLDEYGETIGDANKLTFNLFHNAGGIYDTTSDLIALFRYGDKKDRAFWRQIGASAGFMVKSITYKPQDYDNYNGKNGNKK